MRACVLVRPSIHAVSVIASPFRNVIIKLTRRPVVYGYLEHGHWRTDFFCYLIDFNGNIIVHSLSVFVLEPYNYHSLNCTNNFNTKNAKMLNIFHESRWDRAAERRAISRLFCSPAASPSEDECPQAARLRGRRPRVERSCAQTRSAPLIAAPHANK